MPRRRKIGTKISLSGPAWNPVIKVSPKYSRVPGSGTYDTVTRKGHTYFRWRGYIENDKGAVQRRTVYAVSKSELDRKVKQLKDTPGAVEAGKLTLSDFLTNQFLPGMKLRVRPNTYSGYTTAVNLYIIPEVGAVRLSALKPSHVVAWLSDLQAGKRSIQRAFTVLKRSLSYAVELGLLSRNPLREMTAPSAPSAEPYILDLEEIQKVLASAKLTPWYGAVLVALGTSCRLGEILGMRWRDINFEEGYVHITQAMGREYDDSTKSGMRYALTDPKTGAGRRRIDLSEEVLDFLTANRGNQGDLIFPNENGGFLNPSNFRNRIWYPLLVKAGVPRVKFHEFRHAGNTLLAQQGVSLALLQQRLGHSTPAVTLKIYSHVGKTEGQRAATVLGEVLNGTTSGTTAEGPGVRETEKVIQHKG